MPSADFPKQQGCVTEMPRQTHIEQQHANRETARALGTTPAQLRRVQYLLNAGRFDELDREGLRVLAAALTSLRPHLVNLSPRKLRDGRRPIANGVAR